MVAPTLSTYQYQYKDTGILLNGNYDGANPGFVDIEKVAGLGMPDFDVTTDDFDGGHGGITYARFSKSRFIVLDGTLYSDPTQVDVFLDKLIANFTPDDTAYPFYFAGAGNGQRYVLAKAVAFKHDLETIRRIGAGRVQFQVIADDPIKRVDNAPLTMVAGTNHTVTNSGKISTNPTVTITNGFTNLVLTSNTQGKSITLTMTATAGQVVTVDFRRHLLLVDGVNMTANASGSWWDLAVGSNSVKYTVTSGTPTVSLASYSGWL